MDHNRHRFDRREEGVSDSPIYSRLFIVCAKGLSENIFRDEFSTFGTIEEIRLPLDENGKTKGVAYVKFSKTSEAALALEAMNFKTMPGTNRPLKVMVAANRSETASNDQEKYRRLFVTVDKQATENEIDDEFKKFGHITSIILQKDYRTGESKGFAYVSYAKFSQAAKAFEECEKKYRAIFAKPKFQGRPETTFESRIDSLSRNHPIDTKQYLVSKMRSAPPNPFTQVAFMCCPEFNHNQIDRLFDLIPGMVRCHFFVDDIRNVGKGTAYYDNPRSAAHAVDKLNEFEYPPGMLMYVKPDYGPCGGSPSFSEYQNYNRNHLECPSSIPSAVAKLKRAIASTAKNGVPDLLQLTEAIAEASQLVKKSTGMEDGNVPDTTALSYSSVKLPPPQPLADIDSKVAKRCFLVCKPSPPPLTVLRDVFCRFGDLINVYTLPNKTVGYARYATETAADEAIKVLHGAEICGVRMKVLEADEEAPPRAKRERHDN